MNSFFLRLYKSKSFYPYKTVWFLAAVCFLFILLRFPSLYEPHWYGDEGIYQVVGRAINGGRILYKDIWDNKPPLLYLYYAVVNGNLFLIKLLSMGAGLGAVVCFYFLSKKLFLKNYVPYISTMVFTFLFGLPILEGNIANAENFMLLPIIAASLLIFKYFESKNLKILIYSGLLLSIAGATKIVALFDFSAFIYFIFLNDHFKKRINTKPYFYFLLSFVSILLIAAFYFLLRGAFWDFMSGVFLDNVSYVGQQNRSSYPQVLIILKLLLLTGAVLFLYKIRNKLSQSSLFIYIWTVFALYSSFFSARPYIHYLLVILPAFSLLVGNLFEDKKTRVVSLIIVASISLLAYFHFQVYQKNIRYYMNYLNFVTSQSTADSYEAFFDWSTPRDYALASFIKENVRQDERIFVWSDRAQIYALSNQLPIGKYVVGYHITFYKDADVITKEQLDMVRPKYIIQTFEQPMKSTLLNSYKLRYIMDGAKIYEREI